MALNHAGVSADIITATDGGNWALQHIYPFYRKSVSKAETCAFAVNLSAALPSQCRDTPLLIMNDGSFWQNIILHELSLPSVIIAQKGTVTACAVELAMILSSGNIYLAGMDLSVKDIRTHVKPYGFDYLFFNNASRFSPVYSKIFTRSSLLKDGGSMNIYASWFKNQLDIWPKRIFSLGANNTVFENSLPAEQAAEKNTNEIFKTVNINGDSSLFHKRGLSALIRALKDSRYASNLKAELIPLLFPDKKEITDIELENAITEEEAASIRQLFCIF
jgi:hypothetical protein